MSLPNNAEKTKMQARATIAKIKSPVKNSSNKRTASQKTTRKMSKIIPLVNFTLLLIIFSLSILKFIRVETIRFP